MLLFIQVHCYYHGEVEGYKDSMVALSMCSGLRFDHAYLKLFKLVSTYSGYWKMFSISANDLL